MSHFGMDKFFKSGKDCTIRILDEPLSKGWYWDHGVLMHDIGDTPKLCTLGGPYDENIQPVKSTFVPVIHKGEVKILAASPVLMRKIADEGRRLVEQMQARLLVESQRTAARRFKQSKMLYGAKR